MVSFYDERPRLRVNPLLVLRVTRPGSAPARGRYSRAETNIARLGTAFLSYSGTKFESVFLQR